MACVILLVIVGLISLLIALPKVPADFLSKKLLTIEAILLWYPSYFVFVAILNASSENTLSEAAPLVKI